MNWFKFYGQDFLTDMKISQLCPSERLMWVTILCLAHSEGRGGNISYCTESLLKSKMGIQESDREWEELEGVLALFESLDMIDITDNGIYVKNFEKRQGMQFTPAEKQARYREKQKKVTSVTKSKVTKVTLDKKRIDKIRKEEKKEIQTTDVVSAPQEIDKNSEEYLDSLNEIGFVQELFRRQFGVSPVAVRGGKDGKIDLTAMAAKRLVKKHGRDQLRRMLEMVFLAQKNDKYCKICSNALDFEKNYSWYKTYFARLQQELENNKPLSVND